MNSFKPLENLGSDVFLKIDNGYFLFTTPIRSGTELTLNENESGSSLLRLKTVYSKTELVGVYIETEIPVKNLYTSLVGKYTSWKPSRIFNKEEVVLSFKQPGLLYIFTVPDRMFVATTSNLHENLHNFLTMV